ncbi:unnamed protein product [Ceutorhynchus assimilis]|uniref:snRNA-activating protein complex subunit 3 n=1 Tax=Ceutorhynchus assimilis TaxID=467358 RepID=A0A9N9MUM2_9CUCU|nr:unnamed protein product [Ceutorhynchus assimilis]
MEKVYPPEKFKATEPLDLETYFKEYQAELNLPKLPSNDTPNNISKILQEQFQLPFSNDDILNLESLCTISKLTSHQENPNLPLKDIQTSRNNRSMPETHQIVPEARGLSTVRSTVILNSVKDQPKLYERRLTATNIDDLKIKSDPDAMKDIEPGSAFIQRVSILMPLDFLQGHKQSADYLRVQYEIDILSTQTLLDLANSIKCISDMLAIREVDNMDTYKREYLGDPKIEYPSRSFFIENTFYNDMSAPNSIDYSEVIQNWAMQNKIGTFGTKSMNVTIGSLKPRFGYGYVFIHQGNCEHVVCFSDARLLQNCDDLASNKYPKVVFSRRIHNHICFMCSDVHSSWLVVGSDRLTVKNAFLCTECCKSYMFLNGEKIGKFKLYPLSNSFIVSEAIKEADEEEDN